MKQTSSHKKYMRRAAPYMPYVAAGLALGCIAAPFVLFRKSGKDHIKEAKDMRENLTEHQIDKTLKDSFPASDPPGWY